MIIFNISGGLGNQFFQYAFGRSLSLKHSTPLYLDFYTYTTDPARNPKLSYFNTDFLPAPAHQVATYKSTYEALHPYLKKQYRKDAFVKFKTYFTDKIEMGYRKNIMNAKAGYFDGYWGDEKYFIAIKDLLRNDFSLKEEFKTDELNDLVSLVRSTNSVALHIRRGDYVQNAKFAKIFNVLPIDFYKQALKTLAVKMPVLQLFIFSDDISWVKAHFQLDAGLDCIFIDKQLESKDYLEFALMRECRHFIIANSTFSWWAAWLGSSGNSIVIAPANWYVNYTYQRRFELGSFIPKNWTLLS